MVEKPDHIRAHTRSSFHREEVLNGEICGCFYCLAIFELDKIEKWIDDRQTALCPRCSIDSVISSASGFPINREFLSKMHTYWFSASTKQKSGAQCL